jgi:hypothetical protein
MRRPIITILLGCDHSSTNLRGVTHEEPKRWEPQALDPSRMTELILNTHLTKA